MAAAATATDVIAQLADDARRRIAREEGARTPAIIYLAYAEAANVPEQAGRLQRMQSALSLWIDGEIKHVELWFPEESPVGLYAAGCLIGKGDNSWREFLGFACSGGTCYRGERDGSFVQRRKFENVTSDGRKIYAFATIPCTMLDVDKAFVFAADHRGEPFNFSGSHRAGFSHAWRGCTYDRWFCSEFVWAILAATDITTRISRLLHDADWATMDPGYMSPQKLYTLLRSEELEAAGYGTQTLSQLETRSKQPAPSAADAEGLAEAYAVAGAAFGRPTTAKPIPGLPKARSRR